MFFDAVSRVLLDHARGLILAAVEIRRRADAVALVVDGRHRLFGRAAAAAGKAGERGFDLCKHGSAPVGRAETIASRVYWGGPGQWASPRSAWAAAIPSIATTRRAMVLRPQGPSCGLAPSLAIALRRSIRAVALTALAATSASHTATRAASVPTCIWVKASSLAMRASMFARRLAWLA